ncbi:hypothetical protein [Actinocorallia herbida]|uniref:hypothetical protein n=1 Tax=Actinocorallia herbida TaxID=58109 RepID=UPI00147760E8|nr:hypothetical protein [Actinocorallia herbida]
MSGGGGRRTPPFSTGRSIDPSLSAVTGLVAGAAAHPMMGGALPAAGALRG